MLGDALIEAVTHRERTRRDNTKKVVTAAVVGTVAGIAVGVIAGLLLAPKSGKETREDIKELAKKAVDEVKTTGEAVAAKVSVAIDTARQSVGKIKDKLQGEHEYAATVEGLETDLTEAEMKEPKITVVTGKPAAAKPAVKKVVRTRKPAADK